MNDLNENQYNILMMQFFDAFGHFLKELNNKPITDEWYMSNFADQYIKILASDEAFEILKKFANDMTDKYHVNFEYEMIETLRYLKQQSDTNEPYCSVEQKDKIFALYQQDFSQEILREIL